MRIAFLLLLAFCSTAAASADLGYWTAPVRGAGAIAAAQQALRAEGYYTTDARLPRWESM
jgi:hypothetical protein